MVPTRLRLANQPGAALAEWKKSAPFVGSSPAASTASAARKARARAFGSASASERPSQR